MRFARQLLCTLHRHGVGSNDPHNFMHLPAVKALAHMSSLMDRVCRFFFPQFAPPYL